MSWQILGLPELKGEIAQPMKLPTRAERRRAKREKRREAGFRPSSTHISTALCIILVVFFLGLFPSSREAWWQTSLIGTTVATAKQARFAPSDAWCSSLSWLKDNTPDPFDNPDSYYELHESPFQYPESAYGVMAWWDYGYWITRIAHRLPNANPSQNPGYVTKVARFFVSQNERAADEMIQKLDSAYIIVDYDAATNKFWAIATWAKKERTEFYDVYYERRETQLVPMVLFYPKYYRSLSTRLYTFDGKEVTPEKTIVISYQEIVNQEGIPFKAIIDKQEFNSYKKAEAYIASQESNNYKIVGDNPFISSVPLKALEHYRLIYSSDGYVEMPGGKTIPEVKIFKYIE